MTIPHSGDVAVYGRVAVPRESPLLCALAFFLVFIAPAHLSEWKLNIHPPTL